MSARAIVITVSFLLLHCYITVSHYGVLFVYCYYHYLFVLFTLIANALIDAISSCDKYHSLCLKGSLPPDRRQASAGFPDPLVASRTRPNLAETLGCQGVAATQVPGRWPTGPVHSQRARFF